MERARAARLKRASIKQLRSIGQESGSSTPDAELLAGLSEESSDSGTGEETS